MSNSEVKAWTWAFVASVFAFFTMIEAGAAHVRAEKAEEQAARYERLYKDKTKEVIEYWRIKCGCFTTGEVLGALGGKPNGN